MSRIEWTLRRRAAARLARLRGLDRCRCVVWAAWLCLRPIASRAWQGKSMSSPIGSARCRLGDAEVNESRRLINSRSPAATASFPLLVSGYYPLFFSMSRSSSPARISARRDDLEVLPDHGHRGLLPPAPPAAMPPRSRALQ
jgi:hypothetical protein